MKVFVTLGVLFVAIFFTPVSKGAKKSYALASWYGPGLYYNPMACGGILRPSTWGVAHKWLQCGTRLRVCYSGRCANVTVVDRGPFVGGRDFDLTSAVANSLGFSGVHSITWNRR